jgi:hypothetical protein
LQCVCKDRQPASQPSAPTWASAAAAAAVVLLLICTGASAAGPGLQHMEAWAGRAVCSTLQEPLRELSSCSTRHCGQHVCLLAVCPPVPFCSINNLSQGQDLGQNKRRPDLLTGMLRRVQGMLQVRPATDSRQQLLAARQSCNTHNLLWCMWLLLPDAPFCVRDFPPAAGRL